MKVINSLAFLLGIFVSQLSLSADFYISKQILDGSKQSFIKHHGEGSMQNYLAMNLAFEPAKNLLDQVAREKETKLKTRGEAHITLVTPVEYWNLLRPKGITIDELDQIAEQNKIQSSKFKALCLGQGNTLINNKMESTYFVVVESSDLVNIRRKIQELFLSKGGNASEFDATKFYPHITIGFTKRDLHESDGIIKDQRACVDSVKLKD